MFRKRKFDRDDVGKGRSEQKSLTWFFIFKIKYFQVKNKKSKKNFTAIKKFEKNKIFHFNSGI